MVRADIGRMGTELIRNLAQDAKDFALLFFAQPHKFVIQIDGIQRLDEQRLTAAACAVDNTIDPPLLPGNHRHNKPIIPNRDVLLLKYAFIAMRLQEAFERLMNRTLLLIDVPAQPVERDARIIGNGPVREHLAADLAQQPPEVRHHLRPLGQQRKLIGLQQAAYFVRPLEKPCQFRDLGRFESRALDPELRHRLVAVHQSAERQASVDAHEQHRLGHLGECAFQFFFVRQWLQPVKFSPSKRAGHVPANQALQLVKFEQIAAGAFHNFFR